MKRLYSLLLIVSLLCAPAYGYTLHPADRPAQADHLAPQLQMDHSPMQTLFTTALPETPAAESTAPAAYTPAHQRSFAQTILTSLKNLLKRLISGLTIFTMLANLCTAAPLAGLSQHFLLLNQNFPDSLTDSPQLLSLKSQQTLTAPAAQAAGLTLSWSGELTAADQAQIQRTAAEIIDRIKTGPTRAGEKAAALSRTEPFTTKLSTIPTGPSQPIAQYTLDIRDPFAEPDSQPNGSLTTTELNQLARELQEIYPDLIQAEINPVYSTTDLPSDPALYETTACVAEAVPNQFWADLYGLTTLWQQEPNPPTGKGTFLGWFDTYVKTNHWEFTGLRWDFYNYPVYPDGSPYNLHGTTTLGTAGGQWNNGGIAGAAPDAIFHPVEALNILGYTDSEKLYQQIVDTVFNRDLPPSALILNFSIGGPGFSPKLNALFHQLRTMGIAVYVAAGNSYTKDELSFPARSSAVTAGGALDKQGNVTNYSDRLSPERTDTRQVFGFGGSDGTADFFTVGVPNSMLGGACVHGTSYVSPTMAAAAALLREIRPDLTPAELEYYLQLSSSAGDPEHGVFPGVNIWWAVQLVRYDLQRGIRPAYIAVDNMQDNYPVRSGTINLNIKLFNNPTRVTTSIKMKQESDWHPVEARTITPDDGTGITMGIDTRNLIPESYLLKISAENADGRIPYTITYSFAVDNRTVPAGITPIAETPDYVRTENNGRYNEQAVGPYLYYFTNSSALTPGVYRIPISQTDFTTAQSMFPTGSYSNNKPNFAISPDNAYLVVNTRNEDYGPYSVYLKNLQTGETVDLTDQLIQFAHYDNKLQNDTGTVSLFWLDSRRVLVQVRTTDSHPKLLILDPETRQISQLGSDIPWPTPAALQMLNPHTLLSWRGTAAWTIDTTSGKWTTVTQLAGNQYFIKISIAQNRFAASVVTVQNQTYYSNVYTGTVSETADGMQFSDWKLITRGYNPTFDTDATKFVYYVPHPTDPWEAPTAAIYYPEGSRYFKLPTLENTQLQTVNIVNGVVTATVTDRADWKNTLTFWRIDNPTPRQNALPDTSNLPVILESFTGFNSWELGPLVSDQEQSTLTFTLEDVRVYGAPAANPVTVSLSPDGILMAAIPQTRQVPVIVHVTLSVSDGTDTVEHTIFINPWEMPFKRASPLIRKRLSEIINMIPHSI